MVVDNYSTIAIIEFPHFAGWTLNMYGWCTTTVANVLSTTNLKLHSISFKVLFKIGAVIINTLVWSFATCQSTSSSETASSWRHKSSPSPSISRWFHTSFFVKFKLLFDQAINIKRQLVNCFCFTSDHKVGLSALFPLREMKKEKMNKLYENLYFKTLSCEEIFVFWLTSSFTEKQLYNWVHTVNWR